MCFGLNCFQNCWDLIKHTFLWPYLAPIHDYRIFVSLCTHWWLCVCQHFLAKLLLCLLTQNLWGPLQYQHRFMEFVWHLSEKFLPRWMWTWSLCLEVLFRYIKDISIFTHTFLSSDDFVHYHDGVLYKLRYCEISGEKGKFWFVQLKTKKSSKVLVTRKEILRGDQSLPAPALTICPYFIKDVSAQVLKFVLGNDINIRK